MATPPVIVLRPEPGFSRTMEAGRRLGLAMGGTPLFRAVAVDWVPPCLTGGEMLLAGSANVFRLGGAGLDALRHLPVLAVGMATAQAAQAAGFRVEVAGDGTLQDLVDAGAGNRRAMVRLCGRERVAVAVRPGQHVEEISVYEMQPLPLPGSLAETLSGGAIALLHSAAAAREFASECNRLGVALDNVAIIAMAPRIAAAAGDGWKETAVSPSPQDSAVLAIALAMCKKWHI